MLPYVMLLLATASWGASFVVVKEAIVATPPACFLFWRFFLAAAALAGWLAARRRWPARSVWRGGLQMGVLLAGAYALQTWGLRWTGVSNAGFLTGLYVVFTPLLAALIWKRRVSTWTGGCVALTAGGLALVTGRSPAGAGAGDLLIVGCAVVFALHLLATERHAPHHDTTVLNAVQFLAAAVLLGVLWAVDSPTLPPGAALAPIVFTALACTVFGFYCQTWAQARMPATHAAVAVSLEAPFAAMAGRLWLGERLDPWAVLGCVLMFAAFVAIAARPAATRAVEVG